MNFKVNVPVNKLRERFLKHKSFSRIVALAGSTALGQVLILLASPIVTRLYTPDDFGVLSVFISGLLIVIPASALRYELAIPLPAEDDTAINILALSSIIVVIASCFTCLVLLFFGDSFLSWCNVEILKPYKWFLPVSLFGAGMYQVLSFWAMRKKYFKNIAKTRIGQSVWLIMTQVVLGIFKIRPEGLLFGDIVSRIVGSGRLAVITLKEDNIIDRLDWCKIKNVMWRYRKFPILSSSASLLNCACLYMPSIILAAFYGTKTAGLYLLAQRVAGSPLQLIGNAVAQVYIGEAAEAAKKDLKELYILFFKFFKKLVFFSVFLFVGVFIFGPRLCAVVFGENWADTSMFIRIMAPMLIFQFIVSPLSQSANIIEKQGVQLIMDIIRFLFAFAALVVPYCYGWDGFGAIMVYSFVMMAIYIVHFFIYRKLITKALRV
jgi:O-antigen/teichoic acid export membrane protein